MRKVKDQRTDKSSKITDARLNEIMQTHVPTSDISSRKWSVGDTIVLPMREEECTVYMEVIRVLEDQIEKGTGTNRMYKVVVLAIRGYHPTLREKETYDIPIPATKPLEGCVISISDRDKGIAELSEEEREFAAIVELVLYLQRQPNTQATHAACVNHMMVMGHIPADRTTEFTRKQWLSRLLKNTKNAYAKSGQGWVRGTGRMPEGGVIRSVHGPNKMEAKIRVSSRKLFTGIVHILDAFSIFEVVD